MTIFLHRMDGLLLKHDMMNFFSGNSSCFRIFPDFSGFFRIYWIYWIYRIFFKSSNFVILFRDILYDRFFRNLSVFRIFLGILEIFIFYFLSNNLADGIRFYSVLGFFQIFSGFSPSLQI